MPYTLHVLLILYGLTLLLIPVVFMRRQEPAATLAWILGIVFLPFVGALVFVFFGIRFAGLGTNVARRTNQKIRDQAGELRERLLERHSRDELDPAVHEHPIIKLSRRLGVFPPTSGNQVVYSAEAHNTYAMMEEAILAARHHIHLEFYIYLPDEVGNRFADLLIEKARQGVQVRFIYDPVGSWAIQKSRSWRRRLIAEGIRVQSFILTRKIFRPWYLNLRNHRKLLIVDGQTGFLGGLNIASMFLSPPEQFGRWRDAMIQITGPAVTALQWVFVEDWHFATGETLLSEEFFPDCPAVDGPFTVQVLPSGPSDDCETAEMLFFNAVTTAERFVYLMTPYFVPDSAFLFALKSAALRGVDVRLLVPRKTDHLSVYLAGRSNYEELLSCGVKIYEFTAGVLHSKVAIVDGLVTIISSVNLDIRSFIFNFEVSGLIWGEEFANLVLDEFNGNLRRSIEIRLERFKRRRTHVHVAESFCRLLSPLL